MLPPLSLPPLSPLQLSRWSPCLLLQPPSVLSPQPPTWPQSSLRRQPMLLPVLADITATGFGRNWHTSPASELLCAPLLVPIFLSRHSRLPCPLPSCLCSSMLPFSWGGFHGNMPKWHLGMARSHSRCPGGSRSWAWLAAIRGARGCGGWTVLPPQGRHTRLGPRKAGELLWGNPARSPLTGAPPALFPEICLFPVGPGCVGQRRVPGGAGGSSVWGWWGDSTVGWAGQVASQAAMTRVSVRPAMLPIGRP